MSDLKVGLWTRAVDGVLSLVSPRRAVVRAHLRRFESDPEYRETWTAMLHARGYRAAKASANQTGWMGSNQSADGEILGDLPNLMGRSRELGRDDPIGSGLLSTFKHNVIGTGIRPQPLTDDPKRKAALLALWDSSKDRLALADDLTFGEAQAMWLGKVLEDGGLLLKRTKRNAIEPVWFEAIEKDRLATPSDAKPADPQGKILDGVEKDSAGVPVAYWVRKASAGYGTTKDNFTRIESSEARLLRRIDRPGQTHGVPMFHAVLQDIRDLDLLIIASLKRVQVAACFALFIKSNVPIEAFLELTALTHGYQLDQTIEPGMIFKLGEGEEIQTVNPNFPTPELAPFVVLLARRIGAALGVSWQVVLKDFSDSTYSSARTDLLEARQVYVALQWWFIEKALEWIWACVMDDAVLRGDVRLRGMAPEEYRAVNWIPCGWRWVDPLKEAQAVEVELRTGITCKRDVCAARGDDYEAILRSRLEEEKQEQEMRAEMQLPAAQPQKDPAPVVDDEPEENEPRRLRRAG